jgi:hypothetical protein
LKQLSKTSQNSLYPGETDCKGGIHSLPTKGFVFEKHVFQLDLFFMDIQEI